MTGTERVLGRNKCIGYRVLSLPTTEGSVSLSLDQSLTSTNMEPHYAKLLTLQRNNEALKNPDIMLEPLTPSTEWRSGRNKRTIHLNKPYITMYSFLNWGTIGVIFMERIIVGIITCL